ncbi:MAG: HAD family hydrolase [Ruminococcaceae bacterium]|nr:HAD family hydrolase [Oscillospiraceae bacterium]
MVSEYEKRIYADYKTGLSTEEVMERKARGLVNLEAQPPDKTIGEIIKSNIFTYFNLVFAILAFLIFIVGSYKDLTFFPVVVINTLIGIYQEIRSKKKLEKLKILSEPKAKVVRDFKEYEVSVANLVRDDIVVFSAGNQICADATVIEGSANLNEALVTGEADEIKKNVGDKLLSGSFVVSGKCYARLDRVGKDSFVSRLTIEAKKKNNNQKSEMMKSLDNLVKWIGILIIPIGLLMLVNQIVVVGSDYKTSIVSTVGALVGMIPEGLYLLTTVALVVSVMRLAKKKTLVHEMSCIESLARVNVLCVDKTGTITEDKMDFYEIKKLDFELDDQKLESMLCDFVYNMDNDNATMIALKERFYSSDAKKADKVMPFSSASKFSAVSFLDTSYVLGAPDVLLKDNYTLVKEDVECYTDKGYRVLLFGEYVDELSNDLSNDKIVPVALVVLSNKIRENAPETFKYFKAQKVKIKVISGDNPKTVSEVAKNAGIDGAEYYIDTNELETDDEFREAVKKYTVFGRVTPEKKRKIIIALKENKNTVAMTGDGVNDVLALKEADCSIAMASGSDIACKVAQLVLLNSDFLDMPYVVKEGRRVINNIERTAALFLVKNIFSFFFALITIIFSVNYPVMPSQLTLVSTTTIGIPAFFLALMPNNSLVKGKFIRNVIYKAFPAGFTNIFLVSYLTMMSYYVGIEFNQFSTMVTIILGVVGLIMLYRVCKPFNRFRMILWFFMAFIFALAAIAVPQMFSLVKLETLPLMLLVLFAALVQPFMYLVINILEFFENRIKMYKLKKGI